jgi:hypothetical protein
MPSDTDVTLQSDLAALLIRAGADAARRLRELNFPLVLTEQQAVVTRESQNFDAWTSAESIIKKSALSLVGGVPLFRVAPLLSPDTTSAARDCAARIVSLPESKLPFFSPFEGNGTLLIADPMKRDASPSRFENDAVDWILKHLLLSALYGHLSKSLRLQRISPAAAREFAVEVLKVATADDMQYRVIIPLAGIAVASRVALANGSVTFRALSPAEQGDLLVGWGLTTSNFGVTLPAVVLEVTVTTKRNEHNPDTRELMSKWLCAFMLHGYDVASYRAQIKSQPNWLQPFSANAPVALPPHTTTWSGLTPSKAGKLLETVAMLEKYSIGDPRSERDLALHRFSSGAARSNHVDGILDFVIALESLLLPYDEDARRGDLGYRFRLHGAHYLSKAKSERSGIAKQLTDLYSLRSRLVHGGKYPTGAEIETGWNSARQLAQLGLNRAVTEGFPSAVQLKAMLLGV